MSQPSPPLLEPLAQWCASDALSQAAAALGEPVALAVLDWLGALAAGLAEPAAESYINYARVGDPQALAPAERAFLLGAISHLAEVDDGHRAAMLHPGIVSLSPILAVAEQRSLTLGTMRRAIVAGYEASVRVGSALGPDHYRVFHSTATAGSFGAAAAAAVALELDQGQTLSAFGHAGTQATGVWQFLDDGAEDAKAAHPGFAARNGVTAALLAASGLPSATHILEGQRGLAAAWGTRLDPAPLGAAFTPETSALAGRTVKVWPVCGQMHHVLDAVRDHLKDLPGTPDVIEEITVESFAALTRIADVRVPQTPAQARFSTSWCLAFLIVHGALGFSTLTDPRVLDDVAVARLAERIVVRSAPEFDRGYPETRRCRIDVRLHGGIERQWEQEGRRGDPERPFSPGEMKARFADIAAPASEAWRARALALYEHVATGSPEDVLAPDMVRQVTGSMEA